MSDSSNDKMLLIKVKPNNEAKQLEAMLKEFKAEDVKLSGVISIPESYTKITEEGHLLFLFPDRKDFAVALEPDEFQIMAERQA